MGNCPKRYHEERLKDQFLSEGESYRAEYEREFMNLLERLVNDLERRLRRGKDRLDIKPSDPTAALNPVSDELEERRTIIDLQVKETLAKIERCGEEGRVGEAQELMVEVEKYKGELDRLRQLEAENPAYRLEKRMEVCPTCGAFLIIGDALKRIEAHYEGRQHNGWARIRETLAELKEKYHPTRGGIMRDHGEGRGRAPQPPASPEPGEIGEEEVVAYYPSGDRYVPNGSSGGGGGDRGKKPHYRRDSRDERDGRGDYRRRDSRDTNNAYTGNAAMGGRRRHSRSRSRSRSPRRRY